ncbi:Chromodomain-helicase-DNA-binding protein 6 [Chlorella vulgaris]
MSRLREQITAPQYDEDSSDDELSEGGSQEQLERESRRQQHTSRASKKRCNGDADGLPASQRHRPDPKLAGSSDAEEEEAEDDPIESADEAAAADADFQPEQEEEEMQHEDEEDEKEQQQSSDSGWEEEEEDGVVLPVRRPGARRSVRHRQAEEAEEDEGAEEGGWRARRSRSAAVPNYKEHRSDDDEEQQEEEEESSGNVEVEEDEEEEEDSEEQPRRQQAVRRPATRGGRARQAKHAEGRRTGRERQRVCYNEDELLGELDDSSELESSDEEDESNDNSNSDQPARPTRRAAKAAGRAIRKQAGGSKRRNQPRRSAAPAKPLLDSSDEDQSQSGGASEGEGGQQQSSDQDASGSDSGSGNDFDIERCHVEKILESRQATDGTGEEFLCKFEVDRQQLLRNFQKKKAAGEIDPYGDLVNGIHPDWLKVDRVIAQRSRLGRRSYLVKWRGLGYAESTWESEKDLAAEEVHIARFQRFSSLDEADDDDDEQDDEQQRITLDLDRVPEFCNGRQLRDYQRMGLGKTAQAISVLAFQKQFGGCRGPFLVIAPLTTLGHWQREIETWTDMNCVVYAGSQADRELIQRHDLYFPSSDGNGKRRKARTVKPNVVLSSYETVLRDSGLFRSIFWRTVIIDEAHRMKSTASSTRAVIANMDIQWLLLLTGTPVQNNMRELFGLLNLLDPGTMADESEFLERYGDERTGMTPDQVRALQEVLRPILLRRMKEDVETLPEKEEVIIWVELTPEQRIYYKALYENQIATLLAGASTKNMPGMRNLAMELRKVCCHPFLCTGLEEDIMRRKLETGAELASELDQLVHACGKMVLLHKLLPKLRAEGHKVLIFSQFKMMLDVLEDYLKMSGHAFERIDGSTSSRDRQAAIDRFSKEDSESFVFLLSTRAGGQGITLTAADTCIIYDSAKRLASHGAEKEVTIYRLVSKNSYEEKIFNMSSRKYGLDEAILGNLGESGGGGSGGNPEDDTRKIAELLKHGAHCLHQMEAATEQGGEFVAEGIDQILQGRTEKRQIGGRAGNTFSVATFGMDATAAAGSAGGDDKAYWASLLPEAVQGLQAAEAARRAPIILAPRERKQVDYKGQYNGRQPSRDNPKDEEYVADGSAEQDDDDEMVLPKGKKQKPGKVGSVPLPSYKRWRNDEISRFQTQLVQLGAGRLDDVKREADLQDRSLEECAGLEQAVLAALAEAGPLVEQHEHRLAEERAQQKQQHQATLPGAAAAAAGGQAGEAGKAKGIKRAKDNLVQDELQAWVEQKMQKAPPAVAQALRSKMFLDWAAKHADKSLLALKQRAALAQWVDSAPDGKASPDGVAVGRALPALRGKPAPTYWWRDADTRAALLAVHELGWVGRKSAVQSEIVKTMLTDNRFNFHERVRQKAGPPQPPPLNQQQQQQQQQQPGAGAMDGQQGADQHATAAASARPAGETSAPAAAAGAAGASPSKAGATAAWPKLVNQQEWDKLVTKSIPVYLNAVLQALTQPQAVPQPGTSPAKRAGNGSSPQKAGQSPGKRAAAGAEREAISDCSGVGKAADATPLHRGGPASATAYTNPLTAQGGSRAGKAAAVGSMPTSGGKPQLALRPSTGGSGKGKTQQRSILGFMKKKQEAQAAEGGGAAPGPRHAATDDSPGHKENDAAPAGQRHRQQGHGEEIIVID